MSDQPIAHVRLSRDDFQRLSELRRRSRARSRTKRDATLGERTADLVATVVGSWRFIILQTFLLLLWIVANVTAYIRAWDPYPFILLNLVLSFQAAYTAPIIMMSQNRQSAIDRAHAESDYHVNVKAELEIELLHQKIDMLREQEVAKLTAIIEQLTARLPPEGDRAV